VVVQAQQILKSFSKNSQRAFVKEHEETNVLYKLQGTKKEAWTITTAITPKDTIQKFA
jgi:hypothetical protein